MWFQKLFQRLIGSRPARVGSPASPARPIERLEDRRLLSAAPAIPIGPSATVTVDLTAREVAHGDAVVNWNATMLQAIWNAATPPTIASRAMAMVGVAVFDAVAGRHGEDTYKIPGLTARPAADASPEAAAIAAADAVLNSLFPAQKPIFDSEYQATLAQVPDGRRKTDGLVWGQTVANSMIAWRSQDGSTNTSMYQPAPAGGPAGQYELTPGVSSVLSPQWGQVTPWAMPVGSTQFLPPPPPALDSAQYAADFNKTKSLGGTTSTTRTPDQTAYAHFWADVPGNSVTPPGHWDEIAEHVSLQRHLSPKQNARLFGLLNIGLADAAICCWNAKYLDNFWRPVTAINDPRAAQINPATASDPTWKPLWKTPNFPSYTSGHSTFSGAASSILSALFGKNVHFTIGSDNMPGYSRSFTSFTAAADEAGESRVVGGIHFEFDNQAGLAVGRNLGNFVIKNFLDH